MRFGFILGTGRCGTTMLAQMLDAHSELCIPHEIQILFEYSNNGKRLNEVFHSGEYLRYSSDDFIRLVAERCPHRFEKYFDYPNFFRSLDYPLPGFKWLMNRLYAEIAISRGKSIFMEQTPWYGQRIDLLNDLFPDAKYIHMIRDGRDVAISFARTPWWHDDIEQNMKRWENEVRTIADVSSKILRPDQIIHIKYEDIVEDPEKELRKICKFLDIEFEGIMLDPSSYIVYEQFYKDYGNDITSSAMNDWTKTRDKPTFGGSVGAWQRFQGYDFSVIPKRVAHMLRYYGYEVPEFVRESSDAPDRCSIRNLFARLASKLK